MNATESPQLGRTSMGSTRVGAIRSSQVITTFGPSALVDLPKHSVIVAGLDTWRPKKLRLIVEPRLTEKIRHMTRGSEPQLYSPPPDRSGSGGGTGSSTGYIGGVSPPLSRVVRCSASEQEHGIWGR